MNRPDLNPNLSYEDFSKYYYLKEELIQFCRENKLPLSGGKQELTERIRIYLKTGEIQKPQSLRHKKTAVGQLTKETLIEGNIICSEIHRTFFKKEIGTAFSFNVDFQNWLKNNTGKTYADAVAAWGRIKEEKEKNKGKNPISKQFEYNTYIRDFFKDNPGKSLDDAIKAWKYKKSQPGHNRYEKKDIL